MKTYPEKLKVFQQNAKVFAKEDFVLPTVDQVLKIAWLDVWDCFQLFRYAKQIPDGGVYLEIGSWFGGSMLCAFLGTQTSGNSASFIGIDLRIHTELFTNTKIIPDVRFIKTSSDKAAKRIRNNSANLLFLDGAHHYEQVKRDIKNYWPKLKIGGNLLGHDYSKDPLHCGVVRAAKEVFGKRLKRLVNSRVFMVQKKTKELR
ncbi:hypothetical protein ES703_89814 [subsurface metagenome]